MSSSRNKSEKAAIKSNEMFYKKPISILINISLMLVSLIIMFLGAELVCRIVLKPKFDKWIIGPSYSEDKWVKAHYEDNSLFRRKSLFYYEDRINILGLGDSFTFGEGVQDREKLYLSILEKKLNQKFPTIINNIGKAGYNIKHIRENGMTFVSRLKPDIVLYGIVLNDFQIAPPDTQEESTFRITSYLSDYLKKNSYFYFYICNKIGAMLKINDPVIELKDYIDNLFCDENLHKYEQNLVTLNKFCESNNAELISVIIPMLINFKNYPFKEHHKRIANILQKNSIKYIDLLQSFQPYEEKKLWVNPYDYHPNETAQEIIANEIYSCLNSYISVKYSDKIASFQVSIDGKSEMRVEIKAYNDRDDQRASVLYKRGEYDKSLKAYKEAIERNPGNPFLYMRAGDVHSRKNMQPEAMEMYKRGLGLYHDDANLKNMAISYFKIGSTYFQLDSISMAIKSLENSLSYDPKYETSLHLLRELYRHEGDMYLSKNMLPEAIEMYKKDLLLYHDDANLNKVSSYYKIGYIYARQDSITKAIKSLENSLSYDPKYEKSLLLLSGIYHNKGLYDKAIETIKKAITVNSDNYYSFYILGGILYNKGNKKDAVKMYKKALTLNPKELHKNEMNRIIANEER
ncbi:tetratricopeptide repeat protein [candidate division KSB1 bacterium]